MHKPSFKKSPLAAGVALALGATTLTPAKAQESAMEEIVVTGIRSSLISSMETKRGATGVVDAITAEDIGKFPDTNLAESMQRIPGVSIDRVNNEGSKVTVRGFGPEFNLVLLNGRQMPTSNLGGDSVRSWDFANVAAEGVRAVNVYKTFTATKPSGGIGSTIDIRTARPFDNPGLVASFGVKALHDTTNKIGDDWTPELSGIISSTFLDDTLGIGLFFSKQDRDSRRIRAAIAEQFWRENLDVLPPPEQLVDNRAPGVTDTFFPRAMGMNVTDITRTRTNGALTLQYAPTDTFTATLDYTYAEFDNYEETLSSGIWFNDNTFRAGEIDENGAYVFVRAEGEDFIAQKDFGAAANEINSVGLNLDWQVTDNLNLTLDMHDSDSESAGKGRGNNGFMIYGAVCIDEKSVDFRNGKDIPDLYISFVDCLGADENGEPTGASIDSLFGQAFLDVNESAVRQIQLEGEWLNGSSDEGLTSIQFGVANTEVEWRVRTFDSGPVVCGWWAGNQDLYDDDLFTRVSTSGMFDEFSGFDRNVEYYFDWDLEAGLAAHEEACGSGNLAGIFPNNTIRATRDSTKLADHLIDEKTLAAYVQANVDAEFNGMPVTVVGGIRYEDSEVVGSSLGLVATEVVWNSASPTDEWGVVLPSNPSFSNVLGDYSLWLPNLDISLEFRENWITRFSYSQSVTRPGLTDMRGLVNVSRNPKPGQRDGSAGNPDLQPYTADNIDLTLEWYYADGSYAAIGFYRKQIDNFITTQQVEQPIGNLRDPSAGPRYLQAQADVAAAGGNPNDLGEVFRQININQGVPADQASSTRIFQRDDDPLIDWRISIPQNNEVGVLWGWEFAIQHLFGDSGFGVSANYTLTEGDIDVDRAAIGFQFVLPGLSDSANLVGFYEGEKFSARVAYNWRDEFLNGTRNNAPHYTEEFAQLDARVSYIVNDNLEVFVEGINLTNESQRIYNRFPNMFTDANQFKARYAIGARYNF